MARNSSSRSSGLGIKGVSRVDISSSQTSASKRSEKLSDLWMAAFRKSRISTRSASSRGRALAIAAGAITGASSTVRLAARNVLLNEGINIAEQDFARFRFPAVFVFELAFCQPAIADDETVGNTDQFDIRELHARALVAVIEQHSIAQALQSFVQRLRLLAHRFGFLRIEGHHSDLERCDRIRPDDALSVMVLFDRSRHHPTHTDAVATHDHDLLAAFLIQHSRIHHL